MNWTILCSVGPIIVEPKFVLAKYKRTNRAIMWLTLRFTKMEKVKVDEKPHKSERNCIKSSHDYSF